MKGKAIFVEDEYFDEPIKLRRAKPKVKAKGPAAGGFAKTQPVSPAWERLRNWLEARGATAEGVDVVAAVAPHNRRGVVATRNFVKGEVIFSVPRSSCILDEKRAEASPVAAVWRDASVEVPQWAKVALFMLWLGRSEDTRSEWAPVLDMLPTKEEWDEEGGPLQFWSADEVASAECTVLTKRVAQHRQQVDTLFESVVRPGWEAASLPLSPPSFEEFELAEVNFRSRAYREKKSGVEMLVPGVDLCNHENPNRVNTGKCFLEGEFIVFASQPIKRGKEILITYGAKPNRQLLQQFGFLLREGQPMRRMVLGDDAAPVIDFLGGLPSMDGGEDEFTRRLEEACRDGLLLRSRAHGKPSPMQPVGGNLQQAAEALGVGYDRVVARALEDFSTPLEADEALLEAGALSPRQRLAAEYRLSQKRLLRGELDFL